MTTPLVPGSVAEHTGCLLLKIGQVVFRLAEHDMPHPHLRVRHHSVLQALVDNGSTSQLGLGALLRVDPATMVTTLDDLESEGLATRVRDPDDRRRYLIEITESGRAAVERVNAGLAALDDRLLADLSAADRKALHRILRKLSAGPTLPAAFDTVRDQPRRSPAG